MKAKKRRGIPIPASFFKIILTMSVIHVRNLCKNYGDFEALKGISFDVEQGEILGFLGPNGAGKTTTMKILTCFMAASGGEAHIAGHDALRESLAVRRKIGYLPESNPLYTEMTVAEYLQYMAALHDVHASRIRERVLAAAEECGLKERLGSVIGTLSKGYRQRVGLAATLVHDPDILLLDEPTVGLDPNQIVEIRNLIRKLGKLKTVILCSHILQEVELTCNRILIISDGKITASGTPAELKGTAEGHANLRVVIRGEKKAALEVLRALPGIKEVRSAALREKGSCAFELVTAKKKDLRGDVAQAIFQSGMQILEIHRETVSLEQIFNQLTSDK